MNIKLRLQKLEEKKHKDTNDIVFFIDDICTYRDKKYTKEEFDKEFPSFKNCIYIEIE
ncbi:hypothetical protein JHD49_03400 [Sulfurimonas sp. SAG-AH-194-C21]|nr:hypothetical protein [Sulfurimonas sp. SAG-AH-194-C21]MDF1882975.1 hypothetical protein [Sulfurimonas sp. SAG-AH-194-C21]